MSVAISRSSAKRRAFWRAAAARSTICYRGEHRPRVEWPPLDRAGDGEHPHHLGPVLEGHDHALGEAQRLHDPLVLGIVVGGAAARIDMSGTGTVRPRRKLWAIGESRWAVTG